MTKIKKTKYLNGLIALSLGSTLLSACTGQPGSGRASSDTNGDWMNNDTVPGKVVHDERGNEWIWHNGGHSYGLSNMLMGYWLINSMTGAQTRYYPSSRQYRADSDLNTSPVSRPGNVSASPLKNKEGILGSSAQPSVNRPLNRAALKNGYAVNPNSLRTATPVRSSRGGFGNSATRSSAT